MNRNLFARRLLYFSTQRYITLGTRLSHIQALWQTHGTTNNDLIDFQEREENARHSCKSASTDCLIKECYGAITNPHPNHSIPFLQSLPRWLLMLRIALKCCGIRSWDRLQCFLLLFSIVGTVFWYTVLIAAGAMPPSVIVPVAAVSCDVLTASTPKTATICIVIIFVDDRKSVSLLWVRQRKPNRRRKSD